MALLQITEDNFDAEVIESSIPVLLDFWGPRCAPCVALDPAMERLAEEFGDRVKIAKVIAPESRKVCISLRVMGLPTMVGFEGGEEIARIGGDDLTEADVRELVESLAGSEETEG